MSAALAVVVLYVAVWRLFWVYLESGTAVTLPSPSKTVMGEINE